MLAVLAAVSMFVVIRPVSTSAQAGCGNAAGPPTPGTICPDGSIPLLDPTLPMGCPGSSQQGPPAGSTVNCPARPGRAACTYNIPTRVCTGSDGTVVYQVDSPDDDSSGGGSTSRGSLPSDTPPPSDCKPDDGERLNKDNCGIVAYVVLAIQVLSAMVGIVVVGSIMFAGIQYTTAGSDPQKVSAAKSRVRNSLLALFLFIFTFAFLNWLIPGGLLGL